MPTGVDPQIGESASRNSRFADSFSRGRILAETVGVSTAMTVVDVGAFTGETAAWFAGLFPQARMAADRKSLRCADLSGRAPRGEGSCVIHLKGPYAGTGYDHATGEFAGGIDLIHHATGLSDRALFAEAARLVQLKSPSPPRLISVPPRPDHSLDIARILDTCEPLSGTAAETYLRSRRLDDPCCPDLLYNADLTDFETARGWAGMVAIVRDGRGGVGRHCRRLQTGAGLVAEGTQIGERKSSDSH